MMIIPYAYISSRRTESRLTVLFTMNQCFINTTHTVLSTVTPNSQLSAAKYRHAAGFPNHKYNKVVVTQTA